MSDMITNNIRIQMKIMHHFLTLPQNAIHLTAHFNTVIFKFKLPWIAHYVF